MKNRFPAAAELLRRGTWLLRAMGQQAVALQLEHTAASLAFLSLLALVPIVSVVFAVLTALPVFAELRGELQRFLAANLFLPGFSDTLSMYLQRFAARANELSLAATLVFFASAFGMLLTIDQTLNRIWGTSRPRPLGQRLTLYWATLTVAPILLGASLAVNGMFASEWLRGGELRELPAAWFMVLRWTISGVGLTLLYRVVPNVPVRWRDAIWGALIAVVLMELLRRGLGFYVARLPTYTFVYGAFAALPIFLLWLFLLWSAVLAGALLASRLPLREPGGGVPPVATPRVRFLDAASVLAELARVAPDAQGAGCTAGLWRVTLGGDPARALQAAELLAEHGYLVRMLAFRDGHTAVAGSGNEGPGETGSGDVWDEHWALARPAHELTLRAVFDATWGGTSVTAGLAGLAELDEPLGKWAAGAGRTLGTGQVGA